MGGVQIAVIFLGLLAISSHVFCQETLEEWRVIFGQNFREMDGNNDTKTTFAEYQKFFLHGKPQQTLQEYLQEMPDADDNTIDVLTSDFRFFDFDGDDVLSVSDLHHNFNNIDKNNDKYIEEPEFVAYATRMYIEKSHPAFGK